jgi:hypothetical protein
MSAPLHAAAHEPGLLQHLDMLGSSGQRHVERCRQVADIARPFGQTGEHRPSGRIGQRVKDHVEVF